MSSSTSTMLAITQRQTMRGHTRCANSIVHLAAVPGERHIITCSSDGSVRLWDLESDAQIGEDWRDGNEAVLSMALSLSGKTIASGGGDYVVRLWDIETRKVIANIWTGHTGLSNATWRPPIQIRKIPQGFFDGVQNGAQYPSSFYFTATPSQYLGILLERFSSLFCHSHPNINGAIELQRRPTRSIFSHRDPRIVEVPTVQDRKTLFVARRSERDKAKRAQQQKAQSRGQAKASSSQTQPSNASTSGTYSTPGITTLRARPAYSRLVRLLSHLVLFFAVHPLNTSVAVYNQHSSNRKAKSRHMPHRCKHSTSKVNREVIPMFRRRLTLLPTPRLRHVLLLMIVLPQAGSHVPFHFGPVLFFFSAVHLPHMQMGINTAASGRLSLL
ncbi:hypothetical protein BDR03DRAFT_1013231 [Suillus americanus]|nr:hypothetical protein BDR03DRAFT_1013231 [Suillus americanus]